MINILMNGCNGKMGQVITRLCKDSSIMRIAAGVDLKKMHLIIHIRYLKIFQK